MERYGRVMRSEELTARRVEAGLDPNPPLVVVSGRLDLPPDLPVLQDPEARVIIATGADHELEGVEAQVTYERTGDDLPLLHRPPARRARHPLDPLRGRADAELLHARRRAWWTSCS